MQLAPVGETRAAAVFPASGVVAVGGADGIVRVWDYSVNQILASVAAFELRFEGLAVAAPDLVALRGARDIAVWSWKSNVFTRWPDPGDGRLIDITPDGRIVITIDFDGTIRLWDPKSGSPLGTRAAAASVSSAAVSRDGRRLAVGEENGVIELFELHQNTAPLRLPAQASRVMALAFTDNDSTVVSVAGDSSRGWDLSANRVLWNATAADSYTNLVAFSPDATLAIVASGRLVSTDNSYRVVALRSGKRLRHITTHTAPVSSAVFSGDSRFVISGSWDESLAVTDVEASSTVASLKTRLPVRAVQVMALSEDGRTLVTAGHDPRLHVWDTVSGEPKRRLPGHTNWVYALSFSPDGQFLASGSGDNMVRLWSIGTWTSRVLPGGVATKAFGYSQRVSFASDGALAYGAADERIRIWLPREERVAETITFRGELLALAMAPNRAWIAYRDDTGLHLWNTAARSRTTLSEEADALARIGTTALAFSIDSRRLASGDGRGSLTSWRLVPGGAMKEWSTPAETSTINPRTDTRVTSLLFSRSDTDIIVATAAGLVSVRAADTGQLRHVAATHSGGVTSVSLSQHGRVLLSAGADGLSKISTYAGRLLATLTLLDDEWLAFGPDGFFDGSTAAWRMVPFRFPSAPERLYEPERFFNVFYEPGLLGRVIGQGRRMREILGDLRDSRANVDIDTYRRAEPPRVSIAAHVLEADRSARVTVTATDTGAGVVDCRIQRNGALAHIERGVPAGLDAGGTAHVIRTIPLAAGANRLTAYCFNRLGVRSSYATLASPLVAAVSGKPRAHVLAIGIDRYANADFELQYAGRDAETIASILERGLRTAGFDVAPTLILKDARASRVNIFAALAALRRSRPDDLVVVYYAGHGMSSDNKYFILPSDLGYTGLRTAIDAGAERQIRSASISDADLRDAFEAIDAKSIILIIDACEAGQALSAADPRPAPMNANTFAQLAYDKGMYVLAAAQSYQVAREPGLLRHGLLTYALAIEGLNGEQAYESDLERTLTARRWLDYAVSRVPKLDEEVRRGTVSPARGVKPILALRAAGLFQQPRAFYRRPEGDDQIVIARRSR